MLNLNGNRDASFCDGVSRRAMLQAGSLGTMGLSLPSLLARQAAAEESRSETSRIFGRAKRVILLFMWGGPAHQDTWDLKPEGPVENRGEFMPIATNVPGLHISEHFPLIANHADKLALIRSVGQEDNNHSTGAHAGLTGRRHELKAESFNARESDFPHFGSVLSSLRPNTGGLPTFVALPEVIHTTNGAITPGQGGGLIGRRYDPFQITEHPDREDFSIESLKLPESVDLTRMGARRNLLSQIDDVRRLAERSKSASTVSSFYEKALDMVLAPKVRGAFDLSNVSVEERFRYGYHTFGQSVLLAKRLAEAGVSLVTVYWHREKKILDTSWDTHSVNFQELKMRLMPSVDRPIAALLEDLSQSGMLDDTLVVWNSEFGRTPKINGNAGRDHWGPCNTVVMAGAGVPGGQVYGATDEQAAYPIANKVTQDDIAATIYHLLGLHPEAAVRDRLGRPHHIALGEPIYDVLGGKSKVSPTADPLPIGDRKLGDFTAMLRDRGLRHLTVNLGTKTGESMWDVSGWSKPVKNGVATHRVTQKDTPAKASFKGVFYKHFAYTHLVVRLAEPHSMTDVRFEVSGTRLTVPEELNPSEPKRIWQIKLPDGLTSRIQTLDISFDADGLPVSDLAVVGAPIRDIHLARLDYA